MATLSDGAFRFLSLCASPPGSAAVAQRLSSALATVPSFDELAVAAEQHGMKPPDDTSKGSLSAAQRRGAI